MTAVRGAIARMRTSPVFAWNYNSKARIKNNQGGSSSGKTYSILQVIFMRLIECERIATVIGQDIPNLKKGALRDFKDRILVNEPWMNAYIQRYNKSERTFYFKNGSILEFVSFKDAQDAHGSKRDIAFFNEINGIDKGIYEQVAMRTTEEIFMDYNPSEEFWVHEEILVNPKAQTFYSNFSHNPYVTEEVKDYLFSLKTKDVEAWEVYGLGKTGTISEIIYKNFTIVPEMPKNLARRGYGLDFGYTADPTALVECGILNRYDLYIDELLYAYNMKTKVLNERMLELGVSKRLKISADSSEVRVIDDLYGEGWNVEGVDKGPGSVIAGINLLLDYNLFITERSVNILNERKRYRRKKEKGTGKILNEPIKAFDHALDATRYYGMMSLRPRRRSRGAKYGLGR